MRTPGHDRGMRLAIGLAVLLLLAACGERQPSARIGGDAGGVPVTVTAHYDREALGALAQGAGFTRTVVIEREGFSDPFWSHHHHHYHHHAWPGRGMAYEPATSLTLLIGNGPAEGQVLRARLVPGTNTWTVPLRPGREAVVSLQADGGREGWREIGRFTAAGGAQVAVHLAGAQPRIEVTSPASATSQVAPPAATTPAPTSEPAAVPATP